jgi:penicillin-binding protein-related factor A (putative recombinase)
VQTLFLINEKEALQRSLCKVQFSELFISCKDILKIYTDQLGKVFVLRHFQGSSSVFFMNCECVYMLVKAMNCTAVSIQVQELKTELEGLQTAIVEQEAAIVSLHTELFKKTDQLAFITDEKVD